MDGLPCNPYKVIKNSALCSVMVSIIFVLSCAPLCGGVFCCGRFLGGLDLPPVSRGLAAPGTQSRYTIHPTAFCGLSAYCVPCCCLCCAYIISRCGRFVKGFLQFFANFFWGAFPAAFAGGGACARIYGRLLPVAIFCSGAGRRCGMMVLDGGGIVDRITGKPCKPCKASGCPALVPGGGYCPAHRRKAPAARRAAGAGDRKLSAEWHKLYSSKLWKQNRAMQLLLHPYCQECARHGIRRRATDVDHIIPHRGDLTLFNDTENLQSLCHSCHSKKTIRETEDLLPPTE